MLPSTAWHAEFADVNNDGFHDLFVAKGNVEAQAGYAARDPSNLLLGQPDGTFVEGAEAAGIVSYARARGGALVDLNLDGMLDLVVVNRVEPVTLVAQRRHRRRRAAGGRWANGWPSGSTSRRPTSTPSGRGWRPASATTSTPGRSPSAAATPAGSSAGSTSASATADEVDVRVQWPDGETGPWMTVQAGEFAVIERGADEPVPWQPQEAG